MSGAGKGAVSSLICAYLKGFVGFRVFLHDSHGACHPPAQPLRYIARLPLQPLEDLKPSLPDVGRPSGGTTYAISPVPFPPSLPYEQGSCSWPLSSKASLQGQQLKCGRFGCLASRVFSRGDALTVHLEEMVMDSGIR